jgi:hypothetical protein
MERLHNGSEEKGWPKEDSEKIHSEENREERRPQKDSEKESDQKTALARAVRTKGKPAISRLSCL